MGLFTALKERCSALRTYRGGVTVDIGITQNIKGNITSGSTKLVNPAVDFEANRGAQL